MFDEIYNNTELFSIRRNECSENGISVDFCEEIIHKYDDDVIILKIDEFYSSKRMNNPPPSIDCLIIIKNDDCSYRLVLIELRNVSSTKSITPSEIIPKFKTTIDDFLCSKFANIFLNESFNVSSFECYLVSDPLKLKGITQEIYEKKIKGTVYEAYALQKPFKFRKKAALVQVKIPNLRLCCN